MDTQKTVLIVEDEKNIVEILRFKLQRAGYQTWEAYDGEDGLQKARTENPDLILLDVMLPKMIGFDVCKTLRSEGNNVPVIILTAREEEADKVLKKIANRVAQIVKSENILESRYNPYFSPYGYKDAAKVLNGKAPKYYYHLKEIEMDTGDGVKLARYAMRKGLPVMVDKNSDPDYPQFAIKGEYHWDDYFYPYPTEHQEDLVVWDGKMFVEEQLTESIDPTEAKRMRETSDADVVFYGYQHKTDKPVEVGPEELSYSEFEIRKNQIIHSFDKLSQNSSNANRYGKEHDIMFYALYNRKGK